MEMDLDGFTTHADILWSPSQEQIDQSNLTVFMKFIHEKSNLLFEKYEQLYDWSVSDPNSFWSLMWDFTKIKSTQKGNTTAENLDSFENVKWFPQASLNYAENLLRKRDDDPAIVFRGENKILKKLTWNELYDKVSIVWQMMKDLGVGPGDRIALFVPNIPETVICVLAAASLGATCSLCSCDFGVQGVLDRFGQIEPKLFIYSDKYLYSGKIISNQEKADEIICKIPSIQHTMCLPYFLVLDTVVKPLVRKQDEEKKYLPCEIQFHHLPFDHPLYIMFSSGTTGVPKCIVHGAGGTLIQHLKEHQLHCDMKPGDRIFYYTTCGWMMWQWLVSALASQCTLLLYDGSPFYPSVECLFSYLEETKATFFGTSAKYIDAVKKSGFIPKQNYELNELRMIGSTGSPLVAESFDFVYEAIKQDVCLASLSGGTDILSCFVLGCPIKDVTRGQIQCRGLGMKVRVFDEAGHSLVGQKGELVCTLPFPSQPIYFYHDMERKKYHSSYFSKYDNVWCHGDWIEITPQGGAIIYGRSDTTLNPGGVRIGTAEIYRQVEQFEQILESVVVEQQWQNDTRMILFVKMKDDFHLDGDLIDAIKLKLRQNCSPRHVPAKVISVAEIPRTKSGKIVEIAIKNAINGFDVKNRESLANPHALSYFENINELKMD